MLDRCRKFDILYFWFEIIRGSDVVYEVLVKGIVF